jgi:hypothetical protein
MTYARFGFGFSGGLSSRVFCLCEIGDPEKPASYNARYGPIGCQGIPMPRPRAGRASGVYMQPELNPGYTDEPRPNREQRSIPTRGSESRRSVF